MPGKDKKLIDIKQLKYFVVCADAGSFSEASRILYTTQSNVSKVICNMERETSKPLFVRHARGISLTADGKQVYTYAGKILEDMEELEDIIKIKPIQWLNVSANPSSWFADRFVEYYNIHEQENLHCHIYTGNVRDLMNRLRDYKDEISFVYMMEDRLASFQYALMRHQLEFVELKRIDLCLYLGGKWEKDTVSSKVTLDSNVLDSFRYIQNFQDEFSQNYSIGAAEREIKIDVTVVTNSDYIMEKMLKKSKLANISGSFLTSDGITEKNDGIALDSDRKILFGYMVRKEERISSSANDFLNYICQVLKKQNG